MDNLFALVPECAAGETRYEADRRWELTIPCDLLKLSVGKKNLPTRRPERKRDFRHLPSQEPDEREEPLHIVTHWAAAGAVGEVLVMGFAWREGKARFGVDANGGDDAAGTDEIDGEACGLWASDHFEHRVRAASIRGLIDDSFGVCNDRVHGRRAEPVRELEPLGKPVDGEHRLRPELTRSHDREQSDRPAAYHRVDAPQLDACHVRAEKAGREDVPEKQSWLVFDAFRNLERGRIRERHARIFGLHTR